MTQSLNPDDRHLGLITDLYELTMAAGYHVYGMADEHATFELWVRRLPSCRNYLVAAGLEQAIHYLQHLSFAPEQIVYLREHPAFRYVPNDWFERLEHFRFECDVWAIPEGTVVFAGEPLLRVSGPLMQAQIVETYLITALTVQTLIASKAARIVTAAQGRPVFDFGSRRAHGPQAGLLAARAAYLAGCTGTSNTEAGRLLGLPTLGTQAHSWIMSFTDEQEAFRKFGQLFPDHSTLLLDTYDTIQGACKAVASGAAMQAVRLDSGDLEYLSKQARAMFDKADLKEVKIVASNELDEYVIQELVANKAPIDLFGVGTKLVTANGDPALTCAYKLAAKKENRRHTPVIKISNNPEKITIPGIKNIIRIYDDATMLGDLVYLEKEKTPLENKLKKKEPLTFYHPYYSDEYVHISNYRRGEILLKPAVKDGAIVYDFPALTEIQRKAKDALGHLHPSYKRLLNPHRYKVSITKQLRDLKLKLMERYK